MYNVNNILNIFINTRKFFDTLKLLYYNVFVLSYFYLNIAYLPPVIDQYNT